METVKNIKVSTINIPLDHPVWLGSYSVNSREYCLVEVITNDDRIGYGLAFTRGGDLSTAILKNIAPFVIGEDVSKIEDIWEKAYIGNRLNGRQGLFMRALSLVDLALWDLKGKKANMPLYELLGGYKKSVSVLMAGGYYAPDKDINQLCREYEEYVEQGYKHLKLMVGGASMEEDYQRFVALRKILPEEVTLAIDTNGSWTDPHEIARWVNKAKKEGCYLSFIEEPLPPENKEGLSLLRNKIDAKIAMGEFLAGRWEFLDIMNRQIVDVVRADTTLCGGITEWRRIASLAAAYNLKLFPHYYASIHLNVALAFPNVEMIEVVSTKGKNSSFSLIAGENYTIHNGVATPKVLPGLGLTIDDELVKFYSTHEVSFIKK